MIENLQDELYQLEKKQPKGAQLRASIRWELDGKRCSTFFKVLKRQSMKYQTISESYNDDNEAKYSSDPKDIFKFAKKKKKLLKNL